MFLQVWRCHLKVVAAQASGFGKDGAARLKSFSEVALRSRAGWIAERADVCLSSLVLFCFTHVTLGPSICMADKAAKSRGKKEELEIGTEQAAPSFSQTG